MEIVLNKNECKSYKDFYVQIYKDLDGKDNMDFEDYENLNYSASMLDEFLWYYHNDNLKFTFKGFDLEKIKQQKTYDDYEWNKIFKVVLRFGEEYPNNKVEFVEE